MSRVEPQRNVYVGHRYVPLLVGEWDNSNEYEGLSIVTHKGASYTSKKRTPPGIDIENAEFWVLTGNYNAQIEYYRQDVARVETDIQNLRSYTESEITDAKAYVDNEVKSSREYVDGSVDSLTEHVNKSVDDLTRDVNEIVDEKTGNIVDLMENTNVNILSYSDYADGNDWDLAFKEAINDLPHNGELIIPNGHIFEVNQIVPKSNMKISGTGTIKRHDDGLDVSIIEIENVNNVKIEGVTVDADNLITPYNQYTSVTQRNCIRILGNATDIDILDVKLIGAGRDGIYVGERVSGDGKYPVNCNIENIKVINCTRNGISIVCGESIHIKNPNIYNFGLCGIDFEPNDTSSTINNCSVSQGKIVSPLDNETNSVPLVCTIGRATANKDKFHTITFKDVEVHGYNNPSASVVRNNGFHNVVIKGNKIFNYVTGILSETSGSTTISENILAYPGNAEGSITSGAITVIGNCQVVNNKIDGSSVNGIVLLRGSHSLVSENFIYNVGTKIDGAGIYSLASENNIIKNNQIIDTQNTTTTHRGIWVRVQSEIGFNNIINGNIVKNVRDIPFVINSDELQLNFENNHDVS